MIRTDDEMPCNTDDMLLVHQVFRREFAEVPDQVRRVETDDVAHRGVVGDHIELMLRVLHHHHEIEDALIWPKVQDRAPEEHGVTDAMTAEHAELAARVDAVTDATRAWRNDVSPATTHELATAAENLLPSLEGHLDHEEQEALPVCARVLEQEEWNAIGGQAMTGMGPDEFLVFVGAMQVDADPAVWAGFLAAVPPELATVVTEQASPAYHAHMAAVRAAGSRAS